MSYLIDMVEREDNLRDRLNRAHMILEMEDESTAEVLIWNEPETIEQFFLVCKKLIDMMPSDFEDAHSTRYKKFMGGFDDFIVRAYQNQHRKGFIDISRGLLHDAWSYLDEIKNE